MKELFRADVCTVYEEEKGLYIIREENVEIDRTFGFGIEY